MKPFVTFILNIALVWPGLNHVQSQSHAMTDCLSAFQVEFPLDTEAFQQLVTDTTDQYPVLKYMSEDQFTYWYSITADADDTLQYTVYPTNATDQFETVLYQYSDTSFCKDLVHGRIPEKEAIQKIVEVKEDSEMNPVYSNKTFIEKGQRYYLSVLSLNKDYCGHLMEVIFGDDGIRLHAMNKPCYHFSALEFYIPNKIETEADEDPTLELSVQEEVRGPEDEEKPTEPTLETKVEARPEEAIDEPAARKRREVADYPVQENDKQLHDPQLIDLELNEGDKLDLRNVFFYNNTYAFREDSETELKELLRLMEANPKMEIEIGGHSAGNTKNIRPNPMLKDRGPAWNFKGNSKKLSKRRAEAVKTYLVDGGIEARRIKTVGYGDSEKIIEDPKTPDDHRRNMRVEIAIISAE